MTRQKWRVSGLTTILTTIEYYAHRLDVDSSGKLIINGNETPLN